LIPQYTAIAIAAVFALVGFIPLAGRNLRYPLVWLCLAGGVAAGFFAREATKLAADALAPYTALVSGPSGAVVSMAIAAVVGELLKALGPLIVIVAGPTTVPVGIAYGAAAGAGFGSMIILQGLGMALGLIGSPFITPMSTVIAVIGWFFRVLPHIVTTGFVARAGVRGALGLTFLGACVVQVVLGLLEQLPLVAGIPTGLLAAALIGLALYAYLWGTRARNPSVPAAGT
jgi:hypothetical protein